jgi:cytochrome c oxidase assembly protein subunit 15
MLGLLAWLTFRDAKPRANAPAALRTWVLLSLTVLCVQIALGGLTSANFAASACQTLPDCHGSYLPGADLATAFDLGRQHVIGPTGLALGGAERADIHKLHRLGAAATTALILFTGVLAFRAGLKNAAYVVLLLVAAEFSVGIAAILSQLPINVAVAHNWLAAMLLLSLLRLLALCNNRQALF